jgi:2-oxoglutarate dehydrogenase E1 component
VDALTTGRFLSVIPDAVITGADRILVCSGNIGHELRAVRERRAAATTAPVRLPELYPFPARARARARELERLARAREIVWVQEEPANMGALFFVQPRLQQVAGRRPVRSVKRTASASPATGSMKAHALEQAALVALAFGGHERAPRHSGQPAVQDT